LVHIGGGTFICTGEKYGDAEFFFMGTYAYGVKAETVSEYTGFKDRLGNEIYEGDYMSICYFFEEAPSTYLVVWKDGWHLEWIDYCGSPKIEALEYTDCSQGEVIKNFYDDALWHKNKPMNHFPIVGVNTLT
jgi:hypothetical protein